MITQLRLQNLKSWRDTGSMRFAPLTGFFGTNSSGKTSILQFLMMIKQTVESNDRSRVLHTGDKNSYVDLGTFYDLIHNHEVPGQIEFLIEWRPSEPVSYESGEAKEVEWYDEKTHLTHKGYPRNDAELIIFKAKIEGDLNGVQLVDFTYAFDQSSFGVQRKKDSNSYEWIIKNYYPNWVDTDISPQLFKFYDTYTFYRRVIINYFTLDFEELFKNTFYLGPLREYPNRIYAWSGEKPQDVGTRGEWAIPALLASPSEVQDQIAKWLRKVGLIHSFELRPIAPNRRDYEVMVRLSAQAAEVPITDVGFGVSQLLPVLVLCYYVPENAIIILEQPEIHLHPAVQANLADVFIDVIKRRNVQIILESHSEHLLRRLQRRIAEEELQPEQAGLYFTSLQDGVSKLEELDIDTFGNIRNWPQNFFGDEMGDLVAMTEAAMRRQMNGEHS